MHSIMQEVRSIMLDGRSSIEEVRKAIAQLTIRAIASITLSHWTLISRNTFTSLFSTATSGTCSYNFSVSYSSFFLQRFQWTFLATFSCRLLYSFWANISHPLTKCCTLLHTLHMGLSLVLTMWRFIHFVLMACSCPAQNNASVLIFKLFLDNHCQDLFFSTLSGISMTNYPWFFFWRQLCLSSFDFCFLNSPLSIFIIDYLSCSNTTDGFFFSELPT